MSRNRTALSAMKRQGRAVATAVLDRAGLRIVRAENVVVDLRPVTADPIEAAYRARLRPFLIDIPLAACRVLPGSAFACKESVGNPFVDTLFAFIADRSLRFQDSPLADFYAAWQPQSLADVLGLDRTDLSPQVRSAPPLGLVLPWQARTPQEAEKRWTSFIELDNREHGTKISTTAGWKGWGPVDPVVGQQEFSRLITILQSIDRHGYRRSNDPDGDIKGVVLHDGTDARVLVTAGHHRASALTALRRDTAPIRIDNPIVRRSEVAHWPNVRSGLFRPDQALAVFDRLFAGMQPSGCKWPRPSAGM